MQDGEKLTMKSVHDMQFWVFLFPQQKIIMCSKVRQNKSGENDYCRNCMYVIKQSFYHTFSVNLKTQNYGECMETKKAMYKNSKE